MSGRTERAFIVILIIAGVLFGLSFLVEDNETAALLQSYVIPCLTFLALIITSLIVLVSNDPSKGKENESTQTEAGASVQTGDQGSNAPTTIVQITTAKKKLTASNVAWISAAIGILVTITVILLINSGVNVEWKHLPSPDNSTIEEILRVGYGGIIVKTSSGHYYRASVISPVRCESDCWDKATADEWSSEANKTRDHSCRAMVLSKKPPVKEAGKEFVIKECGYDMSYTRIIIDEKNDLWVWHKNIELLEPLFNIMIVVSFFTASIFALLGAALYRSLNSRGG